MKNEIFRKVLFMKVLLCERSLKGHRGKYLEELTATGKSEIYIIAPENVGVDKSHYVSCTACNNTKNLKNYLDWVKHINYVVKKENIDVVHILDGDSITRYCGLGLRLTSVKKVVITHHHFFGGFIKKMGYHMLNRGSKTVFAVHTASVRRAFESVGITNVAQCEYPVFNFDSIANRIPEKCKALFGLPKDIPTIGIVGAMSDYKNIIPFLEALRDCKRDFRLLICGKEGSVTEEQIREAVKPYESKVKMVIRALSEDEYEQAIVASDIIYSLYGHEFDGASGPLTDGVCANKMILACKHGSLGEIVSQNLLGLTAECDDRDEVVKKTEEALLKCKTFQYGDVANRYRELLKPEKFQLTYKNIYGNRKEG